MHWLLVGLLGFIFGSVTMFIFCVRSHRKSNIPEIGVLRIDTSDPEDGPYLFLELRHNIDSFYNEKKVALLVNTENYISQ